MKKIVGLSLKEGTEVIFRNISDAAKYLNLDGSHIRKCLNGSRKSHGGYSWSYSRKKDFREYSWSSELVFDPDVWTKEEDEVIRKFYPSGKLTKIVLRLKRDIPSIIIRARVLGLKSSDEKSESYSVEELALTRSVELI